jgi:hypothetical protein
VLASVWNLTKKRIDDGKGLMSVTNPPAHKSDWPYRFRTLRTRVAEHGVQNESHVLAIICVVE